MFRVRQRFPSAPAIDLPGAVAEAVGRLNLREVLPPGAAVAVAVGSRGIANLAAIVRLALHEVRRSGFDPFLLPAMGSHGGATAQGQRQILADSGITESTVGAPIRDAMDVRSLGRTADGVEAWCSVEALRAAGILLVNRIKPHTDFGGEIGSGLSKMAVVGLGKHAGALAFHRAAHRLDYLPVLQSLAQLVLANAPILGGIALIENQRHETARIVGVRRADLEAMEPVLTAEARSLMPRLPVDDLDLLIVDRIGKNLSGTGMDPNVIGRAIHGYSLLETESHNRPLIRRIFVRDLTPETHGNATGIGMADFTTTRLVRDINAAATYTNALTAMSLQGSKIPVHFPTDRECLAAALMSLPLADPAAPRIMRIADTLALEEVELSEAFWESPELRKADLELLGPPEGLRFDAQGNLA